MMPVPHNPYVHEIMDPGCFILTARRDLKISTNSKTTYQIENYSIQRVTLDIGT